LEHIAERTRGDQPHAGAASLDDRVRDDGRAVGDRGEEAGVRAHRAEAVQDALGELGGRRRDLAGGEPPGGLARDEIGEGPADVDADATSRRCWRGTTPSELEVLGRRAPTGCASVPEVWGGWKRALLTGRRRTQSHGLHPEVTMRSDRVLGTIDFHTAGIGMRLLTSGLGRLPGSTIGEKRRWFQ